MKTIIESVRMARSLDGSFGAYLFAFKYKLGIAKEGVDFVDASE